MLNDNCKIYLGDCLEVMGELVPRSIDLILADLPYDKTEMDWDKILPIPKLWESYERLRKYKAPAILTCSEPFTSFLVVSKLKWYRHKWIWEKDKGANFFQTPYMPLNVCEDILVFNEKGYGSAGKDKPIYNPQMTDSLTYQESNKSKSTNQFSLRQIRDSSTPLESSPDYDGWKRYPKNKLYFPVDYGKNRLHPTQKPVPLLEYLILTYTNEGAAVLDNTMGSGSTGEACLRTGRKFIGIEKDPEYFEVARKRLETVSLTGSKYKKTDEEVPVNMNIW